MTTRKLIAVSAAAVVWTSSPAVVSAFAPSSSSLMSFSGSSFQGCIFPRVHASTARMSSLAESTDASASAGDVEAKRRLPRRNRNKRGPVASTASAKAANGRRKNAKGESTALLPRYKNSRSKKGSNRRNDNDNDNDATNGESNAPLLPLSYLRLGQTISGYVAGLSDFGAFIKTSYRLGVDHDQHDHAPDSGSNGSNASGSGYALLHISQIGDERITDVREALQIGQKLDGLRVIDINYAKGQVGLSLRTKRPKRFPLSTVKRGDELRGRVANVVPYGAFIDVGCKVNALLHVSRMSTDVVSDIREYVEEGQWIKVRVIDVDLEKKTMACSILDPKADEYLDRRQLQMRRKAIKLERDEGKEQGDGKGDQGDDDLKKELKYFEEALRELENAFK